MVLQGAVGEVHVAVEAVLVDQHPTLLVVVDRGLLADRLRDPPAGEVSEHLCVGKRPAEVPPASAMRIHLLQVGDRPVDLVDRRAVAGLPLHVVVADDVDVDVGVLVAMPRAAEPLSTSPRMVGSSRASELVEGLAGRR